MTRCPAGRRTPATGCWMSQGAGQRLTVLETAASDPALIWDDFWVAGAFPWLAHEGLGDGSLVAAESIAVQSRERSDAEFIRRVGAQR